MEEKLQEKYNVLLKEWKDISVELKFVMEEYCQVDENQYDRSFPLFDFEEICTNEEEETFIKLLQNIIKLTNILIENQNVLARYTFLQDICTSYFTNEPLNFASGKIFVKITNPELQYKKRISMMQEYIRLSEQKIKEYYIKIDAIKSEVDFAKKSF